MYSFKDFIHLNEKGNDKFANTITNALRETPQKTEQQATTAQLNCDNTTHSYLTTSTDTDNTTHSNFTTTTDNHLQQPCH